ncbi:MAG: hypothetical protein A2V52_00765 [Actinobacteria bacterium RBG_19FT_COMBO_54_7]|uniref:Uncharacterized protein n=1 Tax=Candidatus Solincola sediminis TaxID=1797199 RepID=A0A1F2WKZ1_9ACTN|nr:MAG: hypothetical protein A2Y75_00985 [Candidatus Solincola sediminis]OFW59449.1 MAG: hypothetical protein A2W01_11435 [Candidatus Solincola sediminis]OFW65942.1 MAG: hypothetical protein A2V52_00765 [Actinobacteria bacterium RBG_19FT_COMBO_54_7]
MSPAKGLYIVGARVITEVYFRPAAEVGFIAGIVLQANLAHSEFNRAGAPAMIAMVRFGQGSTSCWN